MLLFFSCVSRKNMDNLETSFVDGSFKSLKSGKVLNLKENGNYYLLPPNGSVWHEMNDLDTISFGKWKTDGNLIVLNSDSEITSQVLLMKVHESTSNSTDSLYIKIITPFENNGFDSPVRLCHYNFTFNGKGSLSKLSDKLYGDEIQLLKYDKDVVDGFQLLIVPNVLDYPAEVGYNYIYTPEYKIKNKSANTFTIEIPKFTYKYFSYERYIGEYIKIITEDSLMWKNEVYSRVKK